jgi:phosphohistidine phosphatase
VRVLIVRHASAVKRGRPGLPDEQRPLTKDGAKVFKRVANGLARVLPRPARVLTSPLARARRTAELALAAWGSRTPPVAAPALAKPALAPVLRMLARHERVRSLALFGHEPGLSCLLAYLIGGAAADSLGLKKGGAALVEIETPLRGGRGRLVWFLPPRLLLRLGGRR